MMIIAVVVVVVLLVAVVAGLWAAKVGPFAGSGSSSGSGGGSTTFAQTQSATQSAANGQSGGPWNLAFAFGTAITASSSAQTSSFSSLFGTGACALTLVAGAPSTLTVSGASVSVSSGAANGWFFLYQGTSAYLMVVDLSGTATAVGTIGGSGCSLVSLGAQFSSPSGLIDSSAAGQAALTAGGSGFLTNHSSVDVTYELDNAETATVSGHSFYEGATWKVTLSNCDLSGGSTSTLDGKAAQQFTVNVNGTTGAASGAATTSTTCSAGPGAIGVSHHLSAPLEVLARAAGRF